MSTNIAMPFNFPANIGAHPVVWESHVTSPDNLSNARTHFVVAGQWLKNPEGVQHEVLQLEVVSPSDSIHFWILVERAGMIPQPSPRSSTLNCPSTTTINKSANGSGQVSSQLSADDFIQVRATSPSSGSHSHYHVVATLDMPSNTSNPLTVCHLAALLTAVSSSYPEYDVTKSNCYWFVAVVIDAIKVEHSVSVVPANTGTIAGHLRCMQIVKPAVIQRAIEKVMPIWAERRAIYRAMKTTEEVSLGFSYCSGRQLTTVVLRTNERLKRRDSTLKRRDERLKRLDSTLRGATRG